MKIKFLLSILALAFAVQVNGVTVGKEGDQWHNVRVRLNPALVQSDPSIQFDTLVVRASTDHFRAVVKALGTESTGRGEETVCLDNPWPQSYVNDKTNLSDCQSTYTIPAYSEPTLVSCTATALPNKQGTSWDCSSSSVRVVEFIFSLYSIDNNCRNQAAYNATVEATDNDGDKFWTYNYTVSDDDLLPCLNGGGTDYSNEPPLPSPVQPPLRPREIPGAPCVIINGVRDCPTRLSE